MNNLVSVISPCFNSELFLERSIDSVLNQSYSNLELIIIDDCSNDNSRNIIEKKSKQDHRIIKIFNSENLGPAVSRNKGIKKANGRFIAFLDSDDLWYKEKLKIQLNFMIKKRDAFSYGPYVKINEIGEKINEVHPEKSMTYAKLLEGNKIGCLTAIYDTKILGKIFMPLVRKRQDWALWLSIHKKIKYSNSVGELLGEYTVRDQSLSSNKISLIYYHYVVYKKIENLSFFKTIYLLLKYIITFLWKK